MSEGMEVNTHTVTLNDEQINHIVAMVLSSLEDAPLRENMTDDDKHMAATLASILRSLIPYMSVHVVAAVTSEMLKFAERNNIDVFEYLTQKGGDK